MVNRNTQKIYELWIQSLSQPWSYLVTVLKISISPLSRQCTHSFGDLAKANSVGSINECIAYKISNSWNNVAPTPICEENLECILKACADVNGGQRKWTWLNHLDILRGKCMNLTCTNRNLIHYEILKSVHDQVLVGQVKNQTFKVLYVPIIQSNKGQPYNWQNGI